MRRFHSYVLATVLVITSTSTVAAEEFQSQKAKDGRARFNKAMKAVCEAYISDLQVAAKQAITDNMLDEAIRIKEKIKVLQSQENDDIGDPVVRLRRRLENTNWTLVGGPKKRTLRFRSRRRCTNGDRKGIWEALEPRLVIMKFQDKNLSILQFDEQLKSYQIRSFGQIKSVFKGGKRTR